MIDTQYSPKLDKTIPVFISGIDKNEIIHLKHLITLIFTFLISGCAERQVDILDKQGNIVGGCIAGYDWHFYGL